MGFGLLHAVAELGLGLVELALVLLNLGATDAARRELLAVTGESRQAHCLVRDQRRFVESIDQAQQGDLLFQRRQAAQLAEFVEPREGGLGVSLLAQRRCVVTDDDAQNESSVEGDKCATREAGLSSG